MSHFGEGAFRVLADGEERTEDLGFSPYGGSIGARCERCAHGQMYGEHESVWWVRVRTAAGVVGWTSDTDAFDGKDACSAPGSC